jgi:hypothetical protein
MLVISSGFYFMLLLVEIEETNLIYNADSDNEGNLIFD